MAIQADDKHNIALSKSVQLELPVTWYTSTLPSGELSDPKDVSEYTASLKVLDEDSGEIVFSLDESTGIDVGDTNGTFIITFSATNTALLVSGGNYRYDFVVSSDDETPVPTKLLKGSIVVEDTISV